MTYTHLSQTERYQIYALMKAGQTQTEIAHILGAINRLLVESRPVDPAVEDIVLTKLRFCPISVLNAAVMRFKLMNRC